MANLKRGLVFQGIWSKFSGGNNSNLSGFLRPVAGALISLILIHFILHAFFEVVYDAWMWSFAFKFMIVCIIIAIIMKKKEWLTDFWYYTIILVLPIACIIIQFWLNPTTGKEPEVSKGQPVVTQPITPKILDTAMGYHRSITLILDKETSWEIQNIGKNAKVTVAGMTSKGAHLETIFMTNSKDSLTTIYVPDLIASEREYASGQQITFSHIYGDDVPVVHTEPK
jgi:hypothetical protein